jgi:hypothetical protein
MTQDAIADRLVNYADAVAAFSVVNSLAFLVTLSEPEVRCSLAYVQWIVVGGQLSFSLAISLAIVVLRKLEVAARASIPVAPDVDRFLHGFFIARLAVIALFTLFTVGAAARALTLANTYCTRTPA